MILYHGSNMRIDQIDLNRCNRFKDFGRAFYLSADEGQAMELATNRSEFIGGEPVVNPFQFDESLMHSTELKVKIFDQYSIEWAQFVWNNRDEKRPILFSHDYDIVYGPIMNDTIGYQMREYRMRNISLQDFLKGIKYTKGITFQYAFCTQRAIQSLQRI